MRNKLVLGFLFAVAPLPAQDFEFEDPKAPTPQEKKFALPLRGKVVSEVGRQIENRWVFLGPFLGMTLDYQTPWGQFFGESAFRYNASYAIEKDSTYTREGYQFEAIPTEFYWRKSFDKVTVSVGKIITVWGKADILPVSDVISARDATKAFFAQPQEARLGQNAVRLDWYLKGHEFQFLFIPYPVFTRYTDRDHPYAYFGNTVLHKASAYGREVEGGAQYTAYLGGGAISVFGGHFYNRDPLFKLRATDFSFEAQHATYQTTGINANFPLFGFLLKLDTAYQFGRLNQTAIPFVDPACTQDCKVGKLPDDVKKADMFGATVGLDYNTNNLGSFIAEYQVTGPTQKDPQLLRDNPLHSIAAGYSKNFLRDTLSFNAFLVTFLRFDNLLFRFNLTYKLTDVISTYVQYTGIFIASGDPDLRIFDKFDRVDFQLAYAFDLAK